MAPDADSSTWQAAWRSLPTAYQSSLLTEDVTDQHSDAKTFCTLLDMHLSGHGNLIRDVVETVYRNQSCASDGDDQVPTQEDVAPIK